MAPRRFWKNDGNMEDVDGLSGKQRTQCSDGLSLVVVLDVAVQDILSEQSDS